MGMLRIILYKIYHRYFCPDALSDLKKRGLVFGKNFRVHEGVIIDPGHLWHITIGDDVTLAPRVHILAHDGSTMKYVHHTRIGKVSIGNRVFIGASTIIMPGVMIGNNVIVGAGSVVTHDVRDNTVVAGNPAKVMDSLENFIARQNKDLKTFPIFSYDYTVTRNITDNMKAEMNKAMKDRFGYIAKAQTSRES